MARSITNTELKDKVRSLEEELKSIKNSYRSIFEREKRLSSLMDNLPGLAFRCKNDEKFTTEFMSEGCYDLTGYSASYLIDNPKLCYNDLMLADGDGTRIDRRDINKAIKEKRSYQIVYRIKTASGEIKWVYEQAAGVYSDEGQVIAIEGFVTDLTDQKQSELTLRKENIRLRSTMKERYRFGKIVGKSPAMQRVYDLILKAASIDANVIILGETGTGKELVAQAIHESSERADKNFVAVNCGAIPDGLIETEFFGHSKGAFTGAQANKHGYLYHADEGTLFLDEVGDIGASMQTKLLRVLEGKSFIPLGDIKPKKSDFRIVSATNKPLSNLVDKGHMREDFFYRISVIPITLPPLRERREDIHLLVEHLLSNKSLGKKPKNMSGSQMERLQNYDWPGNVRELQNVIQRFFATNTIDFMKNASPTKPKAQVFIQKHEIPTTSHDKGIQANVENYEKILIRETLEQAKWNRTKAASLLGLTRRSLFRRMKRLGL